MLKIDFSKIDGRGVFADTPIKKGTELTCDVLLFDNNVTALQKWSYPWSKDKFSFCVGFGSFFNHSNNPNIKIKCIDKEKLTKTFVLLADTNPGDELLLKYK